ncbi:MAG TPA: ATP synthase F1 subunit delta [Actinomycetota bacterium]
MAGERLVRGYAEAFFLIAEAEGELDAVTDQLFAFGKLLDRQSDVRASLTDAALPVENKVALVREVLGDRANPNAVNLLALMVEQGHARETARVADELASVVAERRKHVLAEVRSAVPLDDAHRTRLAAALSKATGKTVEIKVVVDPEVVGGVVAWVGDEMFDGSVRGHLEEAKEQLTGA